jgi:hypothetical protein
MEVQFLLVGVVAIGSLTSAPDSDAHSGGGGGQGGAMIHGGWHPGGLRGPKGRIL